MRWTFFLLMALILCSCKTTQQTKTEYFTEIVEVHDTIRDVSVKLVHDSIFLHDSIIVDQEGKVVEKYVYRDRWHDAETKIVHDSIVVYRDSIKSDINEVVVKEEPKWFVKFGMIGWIVALILVLLFVIVRKM